MKDSIQRSCKHNVWLVKENGYFWSCKYCKWLNNFQKRNIEMLHLHFFSSINSIIFSCFTQKGKCYNHSSSYLFLLRYAEIQKGKCNNDFLSYQFLLRILSACGERMYSSTICFHLRRQSQPLKKLWTFLILAMSGSSSSSLFSPLKSIRLMSFQFRMKITENMDNKSTTMTRLGQFHDFKNIGLKIQNRSHVCWNNPIQWVLDCFNTN